MSGLMKVMTCILGALAVVACLATIGIFGYSMSGAGNRGSAQTAEDTTDVWNTAAVPTQIPANGQGVQEPQSLSLPELPKLAEQEEHVHDYKEEVVNSATCYRAGRVRYYCKCGDEYFVDIMSTGHVAGDWEVTRKPSIDRAGIRVQKCIYCDEIMVQENIPFEDETKKDEQGEDEEDEDKTSHVHQFLAEVEREPSCILAGLRKYTCSCGDFYTEMIPAPGHIATDWTVAEEPTTTYMGTEQRTCTECGVVLDSRPINKLSASPSASASASNQQTTQPTATAAPSNSPSAQPAGSSGSQASASPSASATPTHSHEYRSYVLKQANCTEKGIRSFVCTCGSSYAESIERDLNSHSYRATVIPATKYTAGYTIFTCTRCNQSYFDNYTPLITK